MKKIFILLLSTAALTACKQSGHMEDRQPYSASETGTTTSEEVTSGGVRTSPEATSDSTAQNSNSTSGTPGSAEGNDTVKKPAPLSKRNEVTPSDISKPQ
ncbi:membrane lipoprotein lipid attachment site-containing protein [Flavobacterium sp. RHBU_24]|uniref:membrane lipoprotein lipid attachment site-containing protein n=1 Tax=Flavobacterium sp. RHBU_24 TaxID=3391185 RepID=UPI0039850FF7